MKRSEAAVVDAAATLAAAAGALAPNPDAIKAFQGRFRSYLRRRGERRRILAASAESRTRPLFTNETIPQLLSLYEEATANVFCPTGEGGGVDPTCKPGGTPGSGKLGMEGEKKARSDARAKAVRAEAETIKMTNDRVKGEGVDRNDIDAIEDAMTEDEKDEMISTIDDYAEDWAREQVGKYDPDDDLDDDDREVAAKEAGWDDAGVRDKATEAAKAFLGDDADDDVKSQLDSDIDDWYGDTDTSGPDAIDSLAEHLDREEWDSGVVRAVRELRVDAESDLDEKLEDRRKELRDARTESLKEDYDRGDDRRTYLREFYDAHSDEPRFSGEKTLDVWGRDSDGDRVYQFETKAGNSYEIFASNSKIEGHPVVEVGFYDESGSFAVTGAGGAHEVLSKVSSAVTALVVKDDPPVLTFTAAEPSRQKLYDRLVRTVAAAVPTRAAVAIELPLGGRRYVIIMRDELGRYQGMIPARVSSEVLVNEDRRATWRGVPVVVLESVIDPAWFTPEGWPDGTEERKPAANALPSQRASAAALYELSDEYTRAEARDVARAVLQGYANDKSPEAVSKVLQKQLGIDKAQADVLATTELTRVAAADALSEAGKAALETGRKGKVRFISKDKSCPLCQALHGKVYTLAKAQDVIPVHPGCHCRWQFLGGAVTKNVFCPTGKGGGIDPTCGKGGEGGGEAENDLTGRDRVLNDPGVLKELNIPEVMYHVTDRKNVKSILKKGLKVGSDRASTLGKIHGVYLTDDPGDLSRQGGDVGGGDVVTLKVRTKGLNLRLDPEYFYYDDVSAKGAKAYVESVNQGEDLYALYSKKSIPPDHIEISDE